MDDIAESTMEPFKPIEQEIIVLKAAWGLIYEMVNFEMFTPIKAGAVEVHPTDSVHQRLFNILLIDFLDKPGAETFDLIKPTKSSSDDFISHLSYLQQIADRPMMNTENPDLLRRPVTAFNDWLNTEFTVRDVWLSTIERKTDLTLRRVEYIKICGNIAKHGFSRLSWDVSIMRKILKRNDVAIDRDQAYMALPDFYAWFHDNIFNYHIGQIAAHLNDIRWGIYDYLAPMFAWAYMKQPHPSIPDWYEYRYPPAVTRLLARSMFWDLMNDVRSEPFVPRFHIHPILTQRY
ncbi:hypothetical protein [Caulobacter sp. DWR1-3-2b1]|uniref:hypothetical protein n=1 Tax=Caulobacter sp. DWR1-3-2b1 TaxID=2804670 RepID=UPI003CE7AE32